MPPRLTVVIPTYNRPGLFPRALDCLLRQTVAPQIIIADDGECDRTRSILDDRYAGPLDAGQLVHLPTGATDPWSNWMAGALAAGSEYVAWLQDDDVVCDRYAERILSAFDGAGAGGARPHVWLARLECSDATGTMSIPLAGNGPMVPTRSMFGTCEAAHWSGGKALAASMYLTSWSLSPALAYRNGPEFRDALGSMPPACDIFVERIIPAEMARHGGFIADPAVVGLWVQHDGHLSKQQHPDQPRQTGLLIRHLDGLMDRLGGWEREFAAWLGIIPPQAIVGWLNQLDTTEEEGGTSRHGEAIRRLMIESIADRVRATPGPPDGRPWWRRAASAAAGALNRRRRRRRRRPAPTAA